MQKIKVLLDPGHGGTDRANRGHNGYVEADGVLDIALKLKAKLERTGAFEVHMTRTKDTTVSLYNRGTQAKGFDLFISIHTNACADGSARGPVTIYSVDLPADKNFADALTKAISEVTGVPARKSYTRLADWAQSGIDDGTKGEDYYRVIDDAQDAGCKHVFIIEALFHDNLKDEAILLVEDNRSKIAESIAKTCCNQFGIKYPTIVEPPIRLGDTILKAVSTDYAGWVAFSKGNGIEKNLFTLIEKVYEYAKNH